MKSDFKKETKTIFKAIFAWEDEKEEQWLEEMAANGWRLEKVIPYVYTFHRSEPETIVYRLDYKNGLDKDYQEYLALFKDTGWELFTTFSGWHYFRSTVKNNLVPEIYNSSRIKAQKYRRLLWTVLPILLITISPVVQLFLLEHNPRTEWFYIGLEIFFTASILFMFYAIIRVWLKIRQLESKHVE